MLSRNAWPGVVATLLLLPLAGCGGSGGATPDASSLPAVSPASEPPVTSPSAESTGSPSPGGNPPTPATTTTPKPITSPEGVEMVKSGGIAGISETIVVKADGTWSRVTGKGKPSATGKLTAAQMDQLQKLIADPRLEAEADRGNSGPGNCADSFEYTLHVRYRLIHYEACGQTNPPEVTKQIIALLQTATKGQ